jgi:gliding motility-associated-like protein
MSTGKVIIKFLFLTFWFYFFSSYDFAAQTFQNASLEVWGNTNTCLVNTVPDSWVSFSNDGIDFDECDFAVCGSTIPAQAADGNVYGRAYSGTTSEGEGIAQDVTGFIPGNEYQLSFEFAGSNLLPGFNNSQWHIFLDNVDVDQTTAFSPTEAQWSMHNFNFIATNTTHQFGFRACTAATTGGSAAIDNFQIQDITPVVPVLPIAAFDQSTQVICVGDCVVFTNNSQFETQVNWTFESGGPATSQNLEQVVVCYNEPGTYTVELIVANDDGTDAVVVEQAVTVNAFPEGTLTLSGDSLTLITDASIGDFNWTLDGASLAESGYLITPVGSGLYEVSLQNGSACTTLIDLLVEEPEVFIEVEPSTIWIPNAMTFGDDGLNDVWGVYGQLTGLESFSAQVYDRWGEMVFETKDINDRWTGNAFGGTYYVPDGVYLYKVVVQFPDEIEYRQYQGHITVIR